MSIGNLPGSWIKRIKETYLYLTDNTTWDVSTSQHGFVPKATGSTSSFLRADGSWAAVSDAGTFVPTIGDGTNNYTLDRALGWYEKIGNMVFVDIAVRWTSIGSAGAGQLTIKTLPFASNATTGYQAGGYPVYFDDLDTTASLGQIMAYIGSNSTSIMIFRAADNAAAAVLAANSSGATGELNLSVIYRV